MKVYAIGEEGKALQVPGPLIRVPEGTEIQVTLHNLLSVTAVFHGLHPHPGDAKAVVQVPPQEIRELRFTAGAAGTYEYYASAGGELDFGRPVREDSQLAGAFIIDPPGKATPDRIFVMGLWRSGSETAALLHQVPTLPHMIPVINGKSWPYTERLTYPAGEPVRWRWINASGGGHPMHMHGSYFRVVSVGDGESDHAFASEQQPMVATYRFSTGTTITMDWTPPPGHWIHCHFIPHVSPDLTVANALADTFTMDHSGNHMAGLVLGITVPGNRPAVAAHGRTRKIRLWVRERPASNGLPAGFGYQMEEGHRLFPEKVEAPGPLLLLERGRPVEITIVNQLREPTTVHWHSMELESYYDGVAGWGARGKQITPVIQPGGTFRARFTPPRAGTFMYHTHLNDKVQLPAGLYGPLVVLEPGMKFT